MDIRKIGSVYDKKSFDAVIALDVIEHLKKKEGLRLLRNMEKIAKKKVILLTPNSFYHQDALDNNPYQVHHSGWVTSDFKKRGYRVYGLRGYKYLRKHNANISFKPWVIGGILSYISEKLLFYFPEYSFDLFAVKDIMYK